MDKPKTAIGGNLGGSHFAAAGVSQGKLLMPAEVAGIDPGWPQDKILETMAQLVNLQKEKVEKQGLEVVGFGTGAPGPADFDTGVIGDTPNMPSLRGCRLAVEMEKRTGLATKINNDANLTVLGETLHGAGQGYKIVYGVTLGTGFGHGLVIDKKIYAGSNFMAMEMAKAPLGIDRFPNETIESVISTGGIMRYFTGLTGLSLDPKQIEDLAKDPTAPHYAAAVETYAYFGRWLGFNFCWAQGLLAPDVIVVGGNIAKGWDCFAPAMHAMLKTYTWQRDVLVKPADLGEDGPIIGGASLFETE